MRIRSGNWYIGCSDINRSTFESSKDIYKISYLLHVYQNEYIYQIWNLRK